MVLQHYSRNWKVAAVAAGIFTVFLLLSPHNSTNVDATSGKDAVVTQDYSNDAVLLEDEEDDTRGGEDLEAEDDQPIPPKRFYVLNSHGGVRNEFTAGLNSTGAAHTAKWVYYEGTGSKDHGLEYTEKDAESWWKNNSQVCLGGKYDAIILGHSAPMARPLFKFECQLPIVVILTIRFDVAQSDTAWGQIFQEGCRRPNVLCTQNNLWEAPYALQKHVILDLKEEYLPSSGFLLEDVLDRQYRSRKVDLQPPDDNIYYLQRAGPSGPLIKGLLEIGYNITPMILPHHGYGGSRGVKDRNVIHIPYQSNTMSFFENLSEGVVYIVPSTQLYISMGFRPNSVFGGSITAWFLHQYVDWYRDDFKGFFCYFDKLEDLIPGSEFRRECSSQIPDKRRRLKIYMDNHRKVVAGKWKRIVRWVDNINNNRTNVY